MTTTQTIIAITVGILILILFVFSLAKCMGINNLESEDDERAAPLPSTFADTEAPAQPEAVDLSDDQWFDLAKRHVGSDWECNKPDGYLNAVKALVSDAAPALLQQAEQEAQRLRDQRDILLNAIRELAGMDITAHGLAGVQRIASTAIEKVAAEGKAA